MRERGDVLDRLDVQPGGLQGGDGRFAAGARTRKGVRKTVAGKKGVKDK